MSTSPATRQPPCIGRSQLFDSTTPRDHLLARRLCARCPLVMACLDRALAIAAEHPPPCRSSKGSTRRGPDGTWGGLLWHSGHVVDLPVLRTTDRRTA